MSVTNGSYANRVLPSGELVSAAMSRLYLRMDYSRLGAMKEIKDLVRSGMPRMAAEDEVLSNRYTADRFPALREDDLPKIVPTITWKEGRAEIEAAKTDVEWLMAALYVQLPAGVGKPSLLGRLFRMRANPELADKLHEMVMAGESAMLSRADRRDDRTMEEILRSAS